MTSFPASPQPPSLGAGAAGNHRFMGQRLDRIKQDILARLEGVSEVDQSGSLWSMVILDTRWRCEDIDNCPSPEATIAERIATEISARGLRKLVDVGCSGVHLDRQTNDPVYRFWVRWIKPDDYG